MPPFEAWLAEAVMIATSLTAIFILLGLLDKALSGRVRAIVRGWLSLDETHRTAKRNGQKLDSVREAQQDMMGGQVAVARHTQEIGEVFCEFLDVPEGQRPDDLKVAEMEQNAMARGATWPGEFTRGGGGD